MCLIAWRQIASSSNPSFARFSKWKLPGISVNFCSRKRNRFNQCDDGNYFISNFIKCSLYQLISTVESIKMGLERVINFGSYVFV